ncbi:MAG: HlyD family efflux transporter periplasmic adaptor subunit [Chloroflexi bacterium]|nr:HlyD family efflux transporter periplasmic adaptor subunit [Chloroflexota bacterium]
MTKMKQWMMVLVVGSLLISGCAGGAAETVSEEMEPVNSQEIADGIIAKAVIEPERWSELRFMGGGTVVEVLVAEGDEVTAGDVLVRLDPTDAVLAVQEAESALAEVQAQLAQVMAEPRPEEITEIEAQLEAVRAALSQTMAQRDELAGGAIEADIAAAQAGLRAAQAEQLVARDAHDDVHDQSNDRREKENADYALYAANEALAAAQAILESQQNMANARLHDAATQVKYASAQENVSLAELALLHARPTPEEIAVSEALVHQAEAALAMAQAALERTELRAPFAGTVTGIHTDVGEMAAPGQVVVVLATVDHLQARTVDLTELDVAQIAEGYPVVMTVDALSELALTGSVREIALQAADYRGDVVYAVAIELDDVSDTPLRWGMTAMVKIELD